MKLFLSLIYLIGSALSLQAFAASENANQTSLSARFATFFPQSSRFQKVYGQSVPVYGAQFNIQWDPSWQLWTGLDGYSKSSRKNSGNYSSTVTSFNLSGGVNYLFKPMPQLELNFGMGSILGLIHLNNRCSCTREKTTAIVAGGMGSLRARWSVHSSIFVTLFVDYSYQLSFLQNHVNVGGAKLGGGLGGTF